MGTFDSRPARNRLRPYVTLSEHPRYAELKKIIDDFPPEKMKKLESYIKQWLVDR
jgi:hypothetical protein